MVKKIKNNSSELGRRLVYQGPRCLVSPGASFEKSATGTKTNISFNILQANICGISNKKVEISHLLHMRQIHIALLQETLHQNTDPYITGYTHYTCKCQDCRGIITYLRNDIQGEVKAISTDQRPDIQKQPSGFKGKNMRFSTHTTLQQITAILII